METFDLEALMETIDTASAEQFGVMRSINLDAVDITKEEFDLMLDQAGSIYAAEEDCNITIVCFQPREGENTFLYSFVKEGEI